MTCRIRAARPDDARALYDLAKLPGGGFTNLPADKMDDSAEQFHVVSNGASRPDFRLAFFT